MSAIPPHHRRPSLQLETLEDRCLLTVGPVLVEPTPELAWVPNDSLFSQQWNMRNTGQNGGTVGADIGAVGAWGTINNTSRVTTAVIDSGIDYTHPDLYLNIWINQGEIPPSRLANLIDIDGDRMITFRDLNDPRNQGPGKIMDLDGDGRITAADILKPMIKDAAGKDTGLGGWADGISNDGDKWVDDLIGWNFAANNNNPLDDSGHGTHISGIIGATGNNGQGVAGVAWNARIMPLKTFDAKLGATVAWIAEAMDYAAAKGAKLINGSWTLAGPSATLSNAISRAQNQGVIVVVAAGNQASNADTSNFYPVRYTFDNLVSVTATDSRDNLAGFSNWGPTTVKIAAPGVNIFSTNNNHTYGNRSGTSMATPHVTAALGLVWMLRPEWNYKTVIAHVLNTADRLPSLEGKILSGRLNIANAIRVPPRGSALPTLASISTTGSTSGGSGTLSLASWTGDIMPDGSVIARLIEQPLPIRGQAVAGTEVMLPPWMAGMNRNIVWSLFDQPHHGTRLVTPSSSSVATLPPVTLLSPRTSSVTSTSEESEVPDTSVLDELFSEPIEETQPE